MTTEEEAMHELCGGISDLPETYGCDTLEVPQPSNIVELPVHGATDIKLETDRVTFKLNGFPFRVGLDDLKQDFFGTLWRQDAGRRRLPVTEVLDRLRVHLLGLAFPPPPPRPIRGNKVAWSAVPHRAWLYGLDLLRRQMTIVNAPGGVGKTAKSVGDVVCVATGKDLLGEKVHEGAGKVLYLNGEDDTIEMMRLVQAFAMHHGVLEAALGNLDVLGNDQWQVQELKFHRSERGTVTIEGTAFELLDKLLQEYKPDLLVLDPLVAFCPAFASPEVMSRTMPEFKRLAVKHNLALLIVHHNKKGADGESAESASGAASIVNLARKSMQVRPMDKDEAKAFGVLPSEAWRYFRVHDAKRNLSPASGDSWYRLNSVTLLNANTVFATGDSVQAVSREPLSAVSGAGYAPQVLQVIVDLIRSATVPYSLSFAGAKNARNIKDDGIKALLQILPKATPADAESVLKGAIKQLIADGYVAEAKVKDGPWSDAIKKDRRLRNGNGAYVTDTCPDFMDQEEEDGTQTSED